MKWRTYKDVYGKSYLVKDEFDWNEDANWPANILFVWHGSENALKRITAEHNKEENEN